MKNLLHGLIFLFFLFPFLSNAQNPFATGVRFDTIVNKSWTNSNWVLESRSFNTYNTNCILNSTTIQSRDVNAWLNSAQTTFTYLPSKKVDQSFIFFWQDPDWILFVRTTNTYNPALQLIKDVKDMFVGNTWMAQNQNLYSYDGNGFLMTEVAQTWNGVQFQNSTRTDYTNSSGGMVISERSQNWSGSNWENTDSIHYTYSGINQFSYSISFDWDGSQWVNSEQSTATYINNMLNVVIDQEWINNAWVNSDRITFTYDNIDRPLSLLEETWDIPTQAWINLLLEEFSYGAECGALPLTLMSFNAEKKSGEVLLQWETANEVNTSGFTIQKSTDAVHFNTIGNVPSAGGKSSNKYSFEDLLGNDQAGIFYYRLLLLDKDGKFTLSDVKRVQFDIKEGLTLFPNPVKDQIIFTMPKSIMNADVRIINQNGSTVISQKFGNIAMGARNAINVSKLPKGMYMIQINDGNTLSTKKFIKE